MASTAALTQDDALLAKVIAQSRDIFFTENSHLSGAELEQQWRLKIAQITTVGDVAPTSTQAPNAASTITKQQFADITQPSCLKRRKRDDGTSVEVNTNMGRSLSSQGMTRHESASSRGLHYARARSNSTASPSGMKSWVDGSGPSYSRHLVDAPPKVQKRRQSRNLEVSSFDPSEWIGQSASPQTIHTSFHSRRPSNTTTSPYLTSTSFNSSSPYMDDLTSPIEMQTDPSSVGKSQPMSRGNSKTSSVCRRMDGLRIEMSREVSSADGALNDRSLQPGVMGDYPLASPDPRQVLSHTGGATDIQHLAEAFNTTALPLISEDDGRMERTVSSDSRSSISSRLSQRTREQVASSSRRIQPAPSASTSLGVNHSTPNSQDMSRTVSSGSQSDRVPIRRLPTRTQEKKKLLCSKCDKRPDGYKGEHELRRHEARDHGTKRKVWICIEATPGGNFLADCSYCQRNKRYNAYYNAAAHLRRKHFNPKPKGEKRSHRLRVDERRGGKGGGTKPSMEVLKHWMKDFEVDEAGRPLDPADEKYFVHDTDHDMMQDDEDTAEGDRSDPIVVDALDPQSLYGGAAPAPAMTLSDQTWPALASTPAFVPSDDAALLSDDLNTFQPPDMSTTASYDPALFDDLPPYDDLLNFPFDD